LRVQEPIKLEVIASGLNAPGALALDPLTGDLLVAEADELSKISAARLEQVGSEPQGLPSGGISLLEEIVPRGVAVDPYTGEIFFSDADGRSIRRLDRTTGAVTTVVQLSDPTQLLGVLRSGVSGRDGFHLFVAEPMIGEVTRVVPELVLASLYAPTPGIQDVAFLPVGQLAGSEAVLAAEQRDEGGQVEQLLVPQIYQMETINPPNLLACTGNVINLIIPDQVLAEAVREALGLGQGEAIACDLALGLTELTAQGAISQLDGLEAFVNLQDLTLGGPILSDISRLAGLTNLVSLKLGGGAISDVSALAGLTNLQFLELLGNQIVDISALAGLTKLQSLVLISNSVSDISALAGLTDLQTLTLTDIQPGDIAPLAGLVNLQTLVLFSSSVSDISALAGLTNLQTLSLMSNQISNLAPLVGLTNLQTLGLSNNQISDISPLVANPGLGTGDEVSLDGNLLDAEDCGDINALVARGVAVDIADSLCI